MYVMLTLCYIVVVGKGVRTILQLILLLSAIVLSEILIILVFEYKHAKLIRNERKRDTEDVEESVLELWQNIISYDHKTKGGDKK